MFLNRREMAIIRKDFRVLLSSPEATPVTIEYLAASPLSSKIEDPVYGPMDSIVDQARRSYGPVNCILRVIRPDDIKIIEQGLLNVNDAILYFSDTIDFGSLEGSLPVVDGSIVFIDPVGTRWEPLREPINESHRNLVAVIESTQYTQAVMCKLEKR